MKPAAAAEFYPESEEPVEVQREAVSPQSPRSGPPARNNVSYRSRRPHHMVDCTECLTCSRHKKIDCTHHCPTAALIAICQDCGKHHPVIADACQSQEGCHRMPTAKGTVEGRPVTVLRDTGCSSVVVRRSLIPDNKLTGQEALCSLIDGTIRRTPVAKIFVQMPYYTGLTTAVCMMNPIYDLILSNIRGAAEPNPSPHLTGAMTVTVLEGPDSADNRQTQSTAAAIPLEDRLSQGPEKETLYPPQKRTDEETEAKPHEVTCHAAREHTHQELKMRTSEPPILRPPAVALLIWIGAVLLQGDPAGEERPIASRQLQPYRFCCMPSADEITLEGTVSVGIRWMMNLLSESSPSLYDRDLDERPCFRLEWGYCHGRFVGPTFSIA